MKHINNLEEIILRLVENNFESVEYHEDSNTITFMSCPNYEKNTADILGYHYYGTYEAYEVSLEEIGWTIEELVSMVVVETKKIVANSIKEKLKNNVIDFLESEIKYLS